MLIQYNIKAVCLAMSLLACSMIFSPACKDRAPETSCIYGNNMPEDELESMMVKGSKLVYLLENKDYKAIYDEGCEDMRKTQTRDQFIAVMKGTEDSLGNLSWFNLEEAYLMDSDAKEDSVTIACNLGVKEADDIHLVKANRKISFLVYKATSDYGVVRVAMRMVWEDDDWKLMLLTCNPAAIKNHLPGYYFRKARESREKNMLRLALLQYKVSILLSELGPNVNEFAARQVAKEAQEIKVDYMPINAIQLWEVSEDKMYKVYNVGILISQGKLYVDISYITASLGDSETIEKEGRELIRFVREKFPEYEQGFDGLIISARSERPDELYHVYRVIENF